MSVLSTICSTVRRWSLSCGLTSKSRSGRVSPSSSSYESKNTESSLELAVIWLREASYVSGPAPRNDECRAAANSMRTVIRSCRSHERSRRSLLHRVEPTSRSAMRKPTVKVLEIWLTTKEYTRAKTLVVVEWLHYSKRIIIDKGADLSELCSLIFVGKMCVLFHVQCECPLFFGKTVTSQNGLLIFLTKETHSETKSWKSSRMSAEKVTTTTVNPGNRRGFSV